MKKGRHKKWLIITWIIIVAVFVCLSFSQWEAQKSQGPASYNSASEFLAGVEGSIIINGTMILIVSIIYINCMKRFDNVYKVSEDLASASKKMEEDYEKKHSYLWSTYKLGTGLVFSHSILDKQYKAYMAEMKRLEENSENGYKCSIEDYVNRELVDEVINKGALNLIPGVMTGLGILGTFLGLTIGLQQFNTGNADEIVRSIAPLMNGIKVAFHTSMYGMMFSLTFNFIYRKQLEVGYTAVDNFIESYNKLVAPDSFNENQSHLQKTISEVPANIAVAMSPFFNEIASKLDDFAAAVSANQVEGFNQMLDKFIDSMNESMWSSFEHLSEAIDETCKMQQESNEAMTVVINDLKSVSTDITKIHDESENIINKMSEYFNGLSELQDVVNNNLISLNLQTEENIKLISETEGFVEKLTDMGAILDTSANNISSLQKKVTSALDKNVAVIQSLNEKTSNDISTAADKLSETAKCFNDNLEESLNETFKAFDDELSEITTALSTTLSKIDATTGKVPEAVSTAYKKLQNTFEDMQKHFEVLVIALHDVSKAVDSKK